MPYVSVMWGSSKLTGTLPPSERVKPTRISSSEVGEMVQVVPATIARLLAKVVPFESPPEGPGMAGG